jgi:NhaP-type Na+/H+ or K+/H+ antiporter
MIPGHYLFLLGLGAIALLVVWIPLLLRKVPLSLPIVCAVLGYALFGLAGLSSSYLPRNNTSEDVVEIVVVIALMGAGLRIDRPFNWRTWQTTWRLLGIAMPLTIAAMAALFVTFGHLALPAALLLAAMLSPTDPVLAADVGVGPPGTGEEGEIRFGLTSEAAFNDGLAFPLVQLAVLLAAAPFADFAAHWFAVDVLARVLGGAALGWVFGRVFGWLTFRMPAARLSSTGDGLAALGFTLICFGAVTQLGLNGFIAVFVMALTFRGTSPDDRFHKALAEFAGQVERLVTMIILVLFGGALATGMLTPFRISDVLFALALLLVVRPVTAWISLIGSPHPRISRGLTAFFGMRGISTLYYLLFALNTTAFADDDRIVAIVGWTIACSIVIHGISSRPLMAWADREREGHGREKG